MQTSDFVIAILIGALVGFVGSVPLIFRNQLAKKLRKKGGDLSVGLMLVLVILSLALMSVALLVYAIASRDNLVVFSIGLIVTFLLSVILSVFLSSRPKHL